MCSQIAITSGVYHFNLVYGENSQLGIASIVVFFALAFTLEVIFRVIRRKESGFKKPEKTLTT